MRRVSDRCADERKEREEKERDRGMEQLRLSEPEINKTHLFEYQREKYS